MYCTSNVDTFATVRHEDGNCSTGCTLQSYNVPRGLEVGGEGCGSHTPLSAVQVPCETKHLWCFPDVTDLIPKPNHGLVLISLNLTKVTCTWCIWMR